MAEAQGPTVHRCGCRECQRDPHGALASQHQAINTLIGCLDERSQRLIVGFLASQYGRGGAARLARITGLSRNTIRRGQRELARPAFLSPGRIRRPGGGRKRVEKKISRDSGGAGGTLA